LKAWKGSLLGFTWNLKVGVLEVPLKKKIKMRDKISFVLQEKLIPALGSVCQLMSRNSCIAICERNTWDSKFEYSDLVESISINFE
jgi:hypothetical protein